MFSSGSHVTRDEGLIMKTEGRNGKYQRAKLEENNKEIKDLQNYVHFVCFVVLQLEI